MKTVKTFFLFAIVLTQLNVFAQQAQLGGDKAKLITNQFGIKMGINASQFYGDGPLAHDNNKSMFGYHGGVFARFMLNQSFAIQPEIMYSTKGNVTPSTAPEGSIKISSKYITFDALFKYYLNKTVNFHIGPELAYLIKAETKYDPDPLDQYEEKLTEVFAELDYGLVVGVELHLNEKLSLGLRYNPMFADVGVKKGHWDLRDTKNTSLLLFGTFGF